MHNTVFLVLFADPCERDRLTTLLSVRKKREGKKMSVFSTSLSFIQQLQIK